jgi:hypothetical protein
MTRPLPYVLLAICTLLCEFGESTAAPPAAAPQSREVQWPQSFALRGFEVRTYGFAVTQPGPIVLDVNSQGAPLDLVLQGPIPQALEQQGSGALHLSYTVTSQDIQRGVLWHVMLRMVPAAAQTGAESAGNIGVRHPPADERIVKQAIQTLKAQRHVPTKQELAQATSSIRAQRTALFNARVAAGEQELVQRRAAIFQSLQPAIDDMRRQKSAGLSQSAPGQSPPAQSGMSTRGLLPQHIGLPPPAPQPIIASLGATEGVPGDAIMINGSGFGTTDGEVHFMIGADPSLDRATPPHVWINNQIIAVVPDPSVPDPSVGATAYNGFVYVVVGGVKSNAVPFHFDPIIDHRLITVPADYLLGYFGNDAFIADLGCIMHLNLSDIYGASGHDQFFRHTLLQNGWIVESMPITYPYTYTSGGISLTIGEVGTNSPFTDVFSWVDTNMFTDGYFCYNLEIPIKGPRGLPDGVVCASKPAAGQACPSTQ